MGSVLLLLYRFTCGLPQASRTMRHFAHWLATSREHTNFTYDLEPLNLRQLAAFTAEVAGITFETALGYMNELEQDQELRQHIAQMVRCSDEGRYADTEVRYGRRLGWYAVARAIKPRVVVETGVDKGLGACVLSAALERNTREGYPGSYFGTDINPAKGYLLSGKYARFGRVLFGDSIETLRALDQTIDLFINDSDHSADYERREYETVESKLSDRAILLGDNAHLTDELLNFALRTERRFLFFREQPKAHWYSGDGIGAAFRR